MEDNKYEQALSQYDTGIDDNQVKKAVDSILKHRDENRTSDVMKFLLSCVELTSLKSTDLTKNIRNYLMLPPSAYILVLHPSCATHFK